MQRGIKRVRNSVGEKVKSYQREKPCASPGQTFYRRYCRETEPEPKKRRKQYKKKETQMKEDTFIF